MQIAKPTARGHANMSSATLTATIEEWGDSNLRHHIKQQGLQLARNEIEVPHDVTKVHVAQGGWNVDAVLLTEDEDEIAGELFVADAWNWKDGNRTVTYYIDNETDPQAEIRQRCADAIAPEVAAKSPFKEDMLSLTSITICDEFRDDATFEI